MQYVIYCETYIAYQRATKTTAKGTALCSLIFTRPLISSTTRYCRGNFLVELREKRDCAWFLKCPGYNPAHTRQFIQ